MGKPASQSAWEIGSTTQGNKKLKRLESSKVSGEGKREGVTVQGEDFPIGTIKSPGAITISLNVLEEEGDPEVDYQLLWETDEVFTMTRSIKRGRRYQYLDVQVAKDPDIDGDNAGKHTKAIELIAMRVKRLPNA